MMSLRAQQDSGYQVTVVAAGLVLAVLVGLLFGSFDAVLSVAALAVVGVVALVVAAAVFVEPGLGIPFMLVTLSFDIAGRVGPVTAYQLVLLLTATAWALRLFQGDPRAKPELTLVDLGMAALFFAAIWSLPTSLDRGDTMVAIVRIGFAYVFYLLCSTYLREQRWMDMALATLVGAGVFHGIVALGQARLGIGIGTATDHVSGPNSPLRGAAFFEDPNYLAAMLAAAVLVALFKLVAAESWPRAGVWAVAAGVCSLGLYATYSRTGVVGVAIGLPILWLTAPKGRKGWVFAVLAAGAAAVLVASPGVVLDRFSTIAGNNADASAMTRVYMAASTTEIVRDYWMFGTGLGAFDMAYPAYRVAGSSFSVIRPHQLPLALWAEMGVAGLFAQLLLTFAVVRHVWAARMGGFSLDQRIGIALTASFAVQSLFQYFLYFEFVWFSIAVLVAASTVKLARSKAEMEGSYA
jgi:O-antigen ligase